MLLDSAISFLRSLIIVEHPVLKISSHVATNGEIPEMQIRTFCLWVLILVINLLGAVMIQLQYADNQELLDRLKFLGAVCTVPLIKEIALIRWLTRFGVYWVVTKKWFDRPPMNRISYGVCILLTVFSISITSHLFYFHYIEAMII